MKQKHKGDSGENTETKSYMRRTFSSRMKSRSKKDKENQKSPVKKQFIIKNINSGNNDFEDIMKGIGNKTPKHGMLTPSNPKAKKEKVFRLTAHSSTTNLGNKSLMGRKSARNSRPEKADDISDTKTTVGSSFIAKFDNYAKRNPAKTMKSVSSRQNISVTDNLSTQSSSRPNKRTGIMPFNLSCSNRPKKLDPQEGSVGKPHFKARKIPKSHKVPFMVFHSTKDLTEFKEPTQRNRDNSICNGSKIVVKTPYEELCKQKKPEVKEEKPNEKLQSPKKKVEELEKEESEKESKYRQTKNKMDTIDERHNSFDSEDSCAEVICSLKENISIKDQEESKMAEIIKQDNELEELLKDTELDTKLKLDTLSGCGSITSSMLDEASPKVDMSNVFGGELDIDKLIADQI